MDNSVSNHAEQALEERLWVFDESSQIGDQL
jgi:hypothetical protein